MSTTKVRKGVRYKLTCSYPNRWSQGHTHLEYKLPMEPWRRWCTKQDWNHVYDFEVGVENPEPCKKCLAQMELVYGRTR